MIKEGKKMKTFFQGWKCNFNNSWVLSLLVVLAVNAGGLAFEDGTHELTLAIQQYGVILTILLFVFSLVLNAFLLALVVSFIYTWIDRVKK